MSMVCEAPLVRGPNKGNLATGTEAGYRRHWRAGDSPCEPCREAMAEFSRSMRERNPERNRNYQRRWVKANPDKRSEVSRRYRESHREQQSERERQWRIANLEKRRAAARRRYAADPERGREYARRYVARRMAVLNIPFSVDQLATRMAYWGNRCWMCGGEYQEVDHVIALARGGPHCLSNLRPACRSCNASKNASDWRGVA